MSVQQAAHFSAAAPTALVAAHVFLFWEEEDLYLNAIRWSF